MRAMITEEERLDISTASYEYGFKDGKKEGLAEGEAIGVAKGEAIGVAKGRAESTRELAVKFIAQGVDIDVVSSITGIPKDEIMH